jgi:hypothetical protein
MRPGAVFLLWASLFACAGAVGAQEGPRLLGKGGVAPRLVDLNQAGNEVRFVLDHKAFRFVVDRQKLLSEGQAGVAEDQERNLERTAENGHLRVNVKDDGTLRWSILPGGREVLALFTDGKNWVLFTPSGYYDESSGDRDWAGGAQLASFVVPSGSGPPDRFPLSLFREYLYRPEVIRQVLYYEDEDQAVERAEREAGRPLKATRPLSDLWPPVAQIISPGSGEAINRTRVSLNVRLHSPSGQPITRVSVMVNGVEVTPLLPDPSARMAEDSLADARVLRVEVPREDVTLSVRAATRLIRGAPSQEVHLRWADKHAIEERHNLYALAVGVGAYEQNPLRFPPKDARDIVAVLEGQRGRLYQQVAVTPLVDAQASKARILQELGQLAGRTYHPKDTVVVFLAGHGRSDSKGMYSFLPGDAAQGELLSGDELQQALGQIKARVLLFLDTCHSGDVAGKVMDRLIGDLLHSGSGLVVFTASTGLGIAQERADWNNGVFTKAVVEGLRGKADTGATGQVRMLALSDYVGQRVQKLTGSEQVPTMAIPKALPDFVLAQVHVPLYRKKWFGFALGAAGAGVVAALATVIAVKVRPDYDRGNTNWLVQLHQ